MEKYYITVSYNSNMMLPPYFLKEEAKNYFRRTLKSVDERSWEITNINENTYEGFIIKAKGHLK